MEHIGSNKRLHNSSLHTNFVWDQPNVNFYPRTPTVKGVSYQALREENTDCVTVSGIMK